MFSYNSQLKKNFFSLFLKIIILKYIKIISCNLVKIIYFKDFIYIKLFSGINSDFIFFCQKI